MRVFDKTVHCEKCGKLLDYEKGSPLWCHRDIDLCGLCEADIMASQLNKIFAEEVMSRYHYSIRTTAKEWTENTVGDY